MRAKTLGIPCSGSQMQTLTLSGNLSTMFEQYYNNIGSASTVHNNRYHCFAELIGANVVSNHIDNRSSLFSTYQPQIESFAMAFYSKIMQDARGRGLPSIINPGRLIASGMSVIRLSQHSANALEMFFQWLEARF